MKLRAKVKCLYAASGMAGLLSVAVVAAALAAPLELTPARPDVPSLSDHAPGSEDAEAEKADSVDPERLAQLAQLDLRRPLYDDQEPATEPVASRPRQPLAIRLIGIAVEPGHSVAMLVRRDGAIVLAQEGETVDVAGGVVKVLQVGDNSVEVEFQGRQSTLRLPEDDQSGSRQ
jgi:hypothetical protein